MSDKKLIAGGLFFITFGIMLGAMGAHYLETIGVEADKIDSFATGTDYLFYNGLGMLAVAGINKRFDFDITNQFRHILYGTLAFSVSIFALVLLPQIGITKIKFLGPITPIGGIFMILGWGGLLVRVLSTYKD